MKFSKKTVRVILSKDATTDYKVLNNIVAQEIQKDITSSHHQAILRSIKRVKELLENNPFAGDNIEKKKIPNKWVKELDLTNLWRIELSNHWRMLYTIRSDKVEVINFVLRIIDHDEYNKILGYKKK